MKKRIISVLTAVFLIFTLTSYISAAAPVLVDNAGLLDESERAQVESLLLAAGEESGASFVIVTVNGTNGKSMQAYADDYFDYGGYRYDGVLLLIDMEEGNYHFSTCGKYDRRDVNMTALAIMEDNILDLLRKSDFYGAFVTYAEDCARIDELALQDYDSTSERDDFEWGTTLFISVIIGIITAVIVTSVLKGQLKSVKQQTRASNYVVDGSMSVTESRDLFLYHHISRTPRPKSNSGGSSGSHRSSSGRSHGGRGGSFR